MLKINRQTDMATTMTVFFLIYYIFENNKRTTVERKRKENMIIIENRISMISGQNKTKKIDTINNTQ